MADWMLVILTLVIAYLTYLVWKVYRRIAWLTGAMETHSTTMLRIEAERGINGQPIKVLAWDPNIDGPPVKWEHKQELKLDTIYLYLPPHRRRRETSRWNRFRQAFRQKQSGRGN